MHRIADNEPKRLGHFFLIFIFLYGGPLKSRLIVIPKDCCAHPVLYIKTRIKIKKWGETRDVVSSFSLQFFLALAAFCVLYNRTGHTQGFSI